MTNAPRSNSSRPVHLDDVSKAIIEQLQVDGRRSYADIGKAVGQGPVVFDHQDAHHWLPDRTVV